MSIPTGSQQRQHSNRHSMFSRASSPSWSDDEDAITPVVEAHAPAPSPKPEQLRLPPMTSFMGRHIRRPSVDSGIHAEQDQPRHFDPAEGEDLDNAHLWQRMLAIQRMFGCYRSARMSAALENPVMQATVPPRACLDLLNDSIAQLPVEARRQVENFLEHGELKTGRRRRASKRGIHILMHHG